MRSILLIFLVGYAAMPAHARCPSGWAESGDQCFFGECNDKKSWLEAQQFCNTLGANLAVLTSIKTPVRWLHSTTRSRHGGLDTRPIRHSIKRLTLVRPAPIQCGQVISSNGSGRVRSATVMLDSVKTLRPTRIGRRTTHKCMPIKQKAVQAWGTENLTRRRPISPPPSSPVTTRECMTTNVKTV